MGVTRRAPWWLTWVLAGGLVAIYIGERILATLAPGRLLFSGLGVLAVVGATAWRAISWRTADEEARRVETLLLLSYAGCVVALIGYVASSETGLRWLDFLFADEAARDRFRTIVLVLWTILLAASLLSALGAQLALGAHRHARSGATGVESLRVRETAAAGLTVALAGSFLLVLGWVVSQRDRSLDLSYFRTASPGEATTGMVSSLDEPLDVLLFFPEVNPVKDEVLGYFRALANATGRVRLEEYDRLASPSVAEEHHVTEDGTIVLTRGDQSQQLVVGAELDSARIRLRSLDREVQTILYPLLRERRTVYFTTGHGELNDPESAGPLGGRGLGGVTLFQQLLGYLNYDIRELGLTNGLSVDVPSDAAMVVVLGPQRRFLEGEMAALDRYLARGGSLLLALDPESEFDTSGLEQRLGVRYVPVPLADDRQYVRRRGDLSDRRLIVTDRFSSHEAVTAVSHAGMGAGILLVGPGYLEPVEGSDASPLFLVRSLPSTFADLDRNYQFDKDEVRDAYNLAAAVEADIGNGTGASAEGEPEQQMRALVFASSAMFSDAVLSSLGLNAALAAEAVKWLGGEEAFTGVTESEEDVPIVHTKAEDVGWFYATILGAPGLVLVLGLTGVFRYRRRRSRS